MAFLEITGLSKSFKDHKVIRDLSIEVAKGEFLVVFGPSGCGKTVFLRLIAGMTRPDAGDIAIDGQSVVDVESREPRRRHGVPELRPLPAHDRFRQHRQPAAVASRDGSGRQRAGERDGPHVADRPCA